MPNFSLYLPDNILKQLDEQRTIPRSRVITRLIQSCLAKEGYIKSIRQKLMQTITNKYLVICPQCRIEIKTKQPDTFQCRECRNYFYTEECLRSKNPRHILIMKAHYKPIHIEPPKLKHETVMLSRKTPTQLTHNQVKQSFFI